MKVTTHKEILQQSQWFILLFTLLCAISAFAWAVTQPTKYNAVVAFDVAIANRASSPEYQYGAYYDLKGAELFTQHLMSWFKSPAFVGKVYDNAGQGYTIKTVNSFTGRFQAKQYSSQQFVVLFYDFNEETAKKLADSVAKTVSDESASQVQSGDQTQFVVKAQTPVVVAGKLNQWMALGLGVVAGFFLSIFVVYVRQYIREGGKA